jgi:hypothetical protein
LQRRGVVIGRDDLPVGQLRRRAVRLWFEDRRAVAQPSRRHGQHATELAAADNADGRAGGQGAHCAVSEGFSAIFAVCAAR